VDSNLSFLWNYEFWGYDGSRLFLSLVTWLALIAQEQPFIQNDIILGLFIFFLQVGVLPHVTISLASHEVSLSTVMRFPNTKNKIINWMLIRVRDKERDLWFLMANLRLVQLEKLLQNALAYRRTPPEEARKVLDELDALKNTSDAEQAKAFYSAKIVDVAGTSFVRKFLNELKRNESHS